MNNLKVFLASSTESKAIADVIFNALIEHFDVYPWYHNDIFTLSRTPIESLEKLKNGYDAMVVVSTYEDKVVKRGIEYNSIRDNLIFEYALGIDYYGREKSVLVIPNNVKNPTGPTDLMGMTHLMFNKDSNGYDSLDAIIEKLINHLNVNNAIKYPDEGLFGKNLLSYNLKVITPGIYSFKATVPLLKKLKIKFSPDSNISWSFDVAHCTQFIFNDIFENSRIFMNKPYDGKEYDALFRINNSPGGITIDYYDGDNIINKKNNCTAINIS